MEEPACAENAVEDAEEAALWKSFAETASADIRDQLIERYLPLSRAITASLFAKRVADDAEFADYMQCATLGLIEAVENFDWRRGVRFNTFATYRIRGAIKNCIANFSERREQAGLLHRLKKERAESIKLGDEPPRRMRGARAYLLREAADITVIWALSYLLEDSSMLVPGDDTFYVEQFYDNLELRRLKERLVSLVDALPDQERRVIKYHYFQNLQFTEIASIFGLTKGRVSQIHKQGLVLLREAHAIAGGLDIKL
jgi:RNA polymerase sigma factor for flagellar operon FliA